MNKLDDVFGARPGVSGNPYAKLGFPYNPFREPSPEAPWTSRPFYRGHMSKELQRISRWVADTHSSARRTPLNIVGTIGAGKTWILGYLEEVIANTPVSEHAWVQRLLLSDAGFARASIGRLLIRAVERARGPAADAPEDCMSLLWQTIRGDAVEARGPLMLAIARLQAETEASQVERAAWLSQWLRGQRLTERQQRELALPRRIDWEGELVREVAELVRGARSAGVLKTFYLLIDQLEEVFRPDFTELRRARMLTDLRTLVDETVDEGAPLGLLLAWTPDAHRRLLPEEYSALASRLQDVVRIPPLTYEHAQGFAEAWVTTVDRGSQGYDEQRQKDALPQIVDRAWNRLQRLGKVTGPGETTPRDLRFGLFEEVDTAAGLR